MVSKAKLFKEMYEAQFEFLEGWGLGGGSLSKISSVGETSFMELHNFFIFAMSFHNKVIKTQQNDCCEIKSQPDFCLELIFENA